jgi:hypothetical protein
MAVYAWYGDASDSVRAAVAVAVVVVTVAAS